LVLTKGSSVENTGPEASFETSVDTFIGPVGEKHPSEATEFTNDSGIFTIKADKPKTRNWTTKKRSYTAKIPILQ
jgi:hypothetical protein